MISVAKLLDEAGLYSASRATARHGNAGTECTGMVPNGRDRHGNAGEVRKERPGTLGSSMEGQAWNGWCGQASTGGHRISLAWISRPGMARRGSSRSRFGQATQAGTRREGRS